MNAAIDAKPAYRADATNKEIEADLGYDGIIGASYEQIDALRVFDGHRF
jgi:hypothetical protein